MTPLLTPPPAMGEPTAPAHALPTQPAAPALLTLQPLLAPPPRRRRTSVAARLRSVLGPAAGVAVLAGVGYVAVKWRGADATLGVLDAPAAKGELKIGVTDRGELESAESVQVMCELEGGGKITTIVPEGTPVKKGDEVAKLDTDAVTKALNEQEVKF